MSVQLLVASHAAGKGTEADAVFSILKEANAAIAKLGKDKVVNASIGAIYDEEENFVTLSAVEDYFRRLPAAELMNYAPIAGLPEFHAAVLEQTFQGFQPDNTYAKAIATPGGTGAVRHVIYNYLEQGQKVLIPDWAWGPYRTIAAEHSRGIETYCLFDEEYRFNLASIKEKIEELLALQDHVVIIFNTPAHNPTGYSITLAEWRKLVELFKDCTADPKKKIIPLIDLAYLDYAGTSEETRGFMKLFSELPENILVTMAYSMSKSFLIYGLRSGALVGLSSSEAVIEEFYRVNVCSNRGVWSNGTRCAQRLLADVAKNPALKTKIDEERAFYSRLLFERANLFLQEAAEVGLQLMPYHSGFFITVPAANPRALAAKLMQEQIYAVPLKKGVRFALCAVPTHKISGMPTKIRQALGKDNIPQV
ncbi:MAG: aminotransferase class I/II-fold pyridoxal phosphate-dependent enzyme [Clostridia bacterium]|jgi:aromatic-amino-acid transaminase|nr:aminotransferase class I/II-fold pyridoxal phosphate-dependent enzyme [Clostridia bacterium]MDD4666039.1 aminotransferase class I/II-fold pyridoxal phosphate-dependent enzyme [Clostridia bacterium]